jgi:predicted CoA-binding protein
MDGSRMPDLRDILERSHSIATVGASTNLAKAAGGVPQYLKKIGFRVIPVNPNASEIFGDRSYATLLDIEEPVDVVQVFRPPNEAPDIARQAVRIGARVLWLQLGITSDEARRIAEAAGIDYVEDRCMEQESRRFGIAKEATAGARDGSQANSQT